MCYPKPGPRCSSHSLKKVQELKEQLENCEPEDKLSVEKKLRQAQKVFYSTPRGQKELTQKFLESGASQESLESNDSAQLTMAQKNIKELIRKTSDYRKSKLAEYYSVPLPEQTEDEKTKIRSLMLDQVDTLMMINENSRGINIAGKEMDNIEQAYQPEFSQEKSKEVADYISQFTKEDAEYLAEETGEEVEENHYRLRTISQTPLGDKLKRRYANVFTYEGKRYVLDMTYSAINPNAETPYVNTLEQWKHEVQNASLNGVEEYSIPPPDPRAAFLPTVNPGEKNPLLDRAELSPETTHLNGTKSAYLTIDQVKVAAVRYMIDENGEPHVYSLETRPGYTQQGYMKKLIQELSDKYEVDKPYSSSSFTQQGYDYTRHLTKPRKGETAKVKHSQFTHEKPFAFVHDWIEGRIS